MDGIDSSKIPVGGVPISGPREVDTKKLLAMVQKLN